MPPAARKVQTTYLLLASFNTLAASLIWGINTIFLLDAGLNNLEAFAANAFFTAGMVIFEVPTGVIADLKGRRASFMLGTITLAVSTLLYMLLWQLHAGFWEWAAVSAFLGLGFTFFSGATEAWLVDALHFTGYKGKLDTVFAKGQIVSGIAMFTGSVGGGLIAQATNLGVPYLLRGIILLITFVLAFTLMRDLGFTPAKGERPFTEMKRILNSSIEHGLKYPPVRWIMLSSPFISGVSFYGFYALQPYLLELLGDSKAYALAGITAAIVAGAQVAGGMLAPRIGQKFRRRTTILVVGLLLSTVAIALMGLIPHFWAVIFFVVLWALLSAATMPVRQAYLNGLIPTEQRATVLSFDSLLGSSGGVVIQPTLGKAADVWGYPASYLLSAGFQALALPFALAARRRATIDPKAKAADALSPHENPAKPEPAA
ncbi:MAG TPA: MFS transporter [Candidatus Saccharimonadales bacterium]|nr:MFS transporter [Candidatus Saccharimonadales bacterium]